MRCVPAVRPPRPSRGSNALALWRGEPFTGFSLSPQVLAERERLTLQRQRLIARLTELGHGPGAGAQVMSGPAAADPAGRTTGAVTGAARRSPLLEQLRAAGGVDLIVVSAPAGSGKSELLAGWAAQQWASTVWVDLVPEDRDPSRFWSTLGAAVGRLLDRDGGGGSSDGSGSTPGQLAERLARLRRPAAIVIDDLHLVDGTEVVGQLLGFLAQLPTRVTVVLASRGPLTPLVAELAGSSRVQYVSAEQLRSDTDVDEVAAGPTARSHLAGSGWTQLSQTAPGTLEASLVDEVLPSLPDRVRSFLVATAHLDRLHRDLCAAVTGRDDAGEMLAWLRRQGLFLLPSHADTSWYRYSDELRDALRRHVELETSLDVADLHRRAAAWFVDYGVPEDALWHAVRAADAPMVADLTGEVLLAVSLRDDMPSCVDWLVTLDPDVVASNPR